MNSPEPGFHYKLNLTLYRFAKGQYKIRLYLPLRSLTKTISFSKYSKSTSKHDSLPRDLKNTNETDITYYFLNHVFRRFPLRFLFRKKELTCNERQYSTISSGVYRVKITRVKKSNSWSL